jgi:hypothetical protein
MGVGQVKATSFVVWEGARCVRVWNEAASKGVCTGLWGVCFVDAFVFVSQGACCVNTERLENGDKSFYTRADDDGFFSRHCEVCLTFFSRLASETR